MEMKDLQGWLYWVSKIHKQDKMDEATEGQST